MKTIAFINLKGGVGKTATSITVSHILAEKYGKKVLVVDSDPQGNTSSAYCEMNLMEKLRNSLMGIAGDTSELTLEDLLTNPSVDARQCIHHTDYPQLDIIPALLTLSEAEERLKADVTTPQQFKLANKLRTISNDYDYCIIDCSPSINIININALVCADVVYIPMKCDAWSGIGMTVARNLISTVTTFAPNLKLGGSFFTQWEKNKVVSQQALTLLTSALGDEIIPITIRKSKLVEEMSFMQKPLMAYDPKHGGDYAEVTKDYLALTDYIIKQNHK